MKFPTFFILILLVFCKISAAPYEHFLLITGCARSGTGYITQVLREAGLKIGHEYLDEDGARDGLASWLFAVSADHVPWGPVPSEIHFEHIFHQVRHPLSVISSVRTHEPQESWMYIIENIPEISEVDSPVVRAAKYWYYWNLRAAERAEWTYQVENLENVWDEMQLRLGVFLDRKGLTTVPKNTNTRGRYYQEKFTWDFLEQELEPDLYHKIRTLADTYGYQ